MAIMILDPQEVQEVREHFLHLGAEYDSRRTECWEGVEVVPPEPNDEHQEIQFLLFIPLTTVIHEPALGRIRGPVNISDRNDETWIKNYRAPDIVVYLNENPAINHGTHWQGGPDFLIEILSPGEDPQAKLPFYASIQTREVLVIDRNPWAVELFRLIEGKLLSAGRSTLDDPTMLASQVLALTFRLAPGPQRPIVQITATESGRVWNA